MGSYNISCYLSKISISPNTKVAIFPIVENTTGHTEFRYLPYTIQPIICKYADYGRFDSIESNEYTDFMEMYHGMPIQQYVNELTEESNPYIVIHYDLYEFMINHNVLESWMNIDLDVYFVKLDARGENNGIIFQCERYSFIKKHQNFEFQRAHFEQFSHTWLLENSKRLLNFRIWLNILSTDWHYSDNPYIRTQCGEPLHHYQFTMKVAEILQKIMKNP